MDTAERIRQREAQKAQESEPADDGGDGGDGGLALPSISKKQTVALAAIVGAAAVYYLFIKDGGSDRSRRSRQSAEEQLEAVQNTEHAAEHDDGEHQIIVPANPEKELEKDSAILDPDAGIFGGGD